MFFITLNVLWSFSFFFYNLYFIFLISIIFYILPIINCSVAFSIKKKNFEMLSGFEIFWLALTPLFLIWLNLFFWTSFSTSAWFGHIIFSHFQAKMTYLILFFFITILTTYSVFFYFSTRETYDYCIVLFNFLFWTIFLFFANSLFTVIFFIEILSTLIFLLLLTSNFSTTFFYNTVNLNLHNYFQKSTPFFFIQTLLFFFWISLISSLNLFFFLILFFLKFLTYDWFLFEFIFSYIISIENFKNVFSIFFIWFNLLFCLFLKCGLVPFYFWKPIFFKGIPFHALMFYICFFYFFIFLFFLYFLLTYVNEIFYYYLQLNLIVSLLGFCFLFFILCESYYIKTFLASSSILNTLFVFLTINATNYVDFFFI